MRVIAGTARSVPLKAPEGMNTRPTTDKIKETLFNMIQFDVDGALFLDCFAGSGAIGIEALSRGAKRAAFMDISGAAIAAVRQNVEKCRFTDRALIIKADAARAAVSAIKRMEPDADDRLIVFMDPPYGRGLEFPVLRAIAESGLLKPLSIVIVEEQPDAGFDEALSMGYSVTRIKEYKNQKHVFLRYGQQPG